MLEHFHFKHQVYKRNDQLSSGHLQVSNTLGKKMFLLAFTNELYEKLGETFLPS